MILLKRAINEEKKQMSNFQYLWTRPLTKHVEHLLQAALAQFAVFRCVEFTLETVLYASYPMYSLMVNIKHSRSVRKIT